MKKLFLFLLTLAAVAVASATPREINLKVVEISDVHGNIFPYDFITRQSEHGGFSRLSTYVNSLRKQLGDDKVILLNGGDLLQGQPSAYYYNVVDTLSPHLAATTSNYLRFDAFTIGNHDIETGHSVYDRWTRQCEFPVLGANVINTKTNRPYFTPYTIINRQGVKIAVIGLLTPEVPSWVPENLWSGMRFDDMVKSAEYWMNIVRDTEKPDIVIGLFHSGREDRNPSKYYSENASALVAQSVPGFDIVMMGHDHQRYVGNCTDPDGNSVLLIDPGNGAYAFAVADISITFDKGKVTSKSITGNIINAKDYIPDPNFTNAFSRQFDAVNTFVSEKVGRVDRTITTRDAYFGPSAFVDMIHQIQLDITHADISFTAPLAFDSTINEGDITVSDMFNIYRFENILYVMELSGKEIKNYLEYSYYLWTKQMSSPSDNLLWFKNEDPATHYFQNPPYNFDSAAGIIYTVDVTKPKGKKINILSMADGKDFDPTRIYRVAINSYRGNGGGRLLTEGAGIWRSMLKRRIVFSTTRDLRHYLMEYIKTKGTISPQPLNQWRFIPEDFVAPAIERNRADLFGK